MATSTYIYDDIDRLTNLTHTRGMTTLADYGWTFDAQGRITGFVNPDDDAGYTCDATGQLIKADHTGAGLADESYSYDASGEGIPIGRVLRGLIQ